MCLNTGIWTGAEFDCNQSHESFAEKHMRFLVLKRQENSKTVIRRHMHNFDHEFTLSMKFFVSIMVLVSSFFSYLYCIGILINNAYNNVPQNII